MGALPPPSWNLGPAQRHTHAWRQSCASTTATCVSPSVHASPAQRGCRSTHHSLMTDGRAWALAGAGRRAEHECPRCHHGQHRRWHGTSHLVAGTQGRPLPARGFISRGPRTPTPSLGESDSTPGSQPHSSKSLPTASVQKLQPPSQPPPGPIVLKRVTVAEHEPCSLPLSGRSAPSWACAPPGPHLRWGDERPGGPPKLASGTPTHGLLSHSEVF